jgi:tetratricopeptide (TPR) repeat protein
MTMKYSQIEDRGLDDGRILDDEELAQRLRDHPDIFILYSEKNLYLLILVSIILGLFAGIWLNTLTIAKIDPEFLEKTPDNRTAELNAEKYFPAGLKDRGQSEMKTAPEYVKWRDNVPQTRQFAGKPVQKKPGRAVYSDPEPEKYTDSSTSPVPGPIENQSKIVIGDSVLKKDTLAGKKSEDIVKDSEDPDIKKPLDQESLIKLNDHATAFALLQKALKRNPRDTSALSGMGFMFLHVGLLDSAQDYYKASLAINPGSSSAHKGLATTRYYLSTLASNPNYARINRITDPAQYIRSQFDSAMIEYTNAITLDSSNVDALSDRGVLRYIHNDYAGAIKDYSLAIKINPSWADAYCKRGSVYKAMGKNHEAIDDYTSAIKLDSSSYGFNGTLRFANAYFGRANLYYKLRKYDLAIRDFDSTIILSPNHSLAMLNRAIALYDSKRYKEALDGFTQAIKTLSPVEYDGAQYLAYLQRGNVFKALGQYDKAIEDYKSAGNSPRLAGKACWQAAQVFCLKKEDDTAIDWLKKSVQNGFAGFNKWKSDKELARLWDRKEFREIVKE